MCKERRRKGRKGKTTRQQTLRVGKSDDLNPSFEEVLSRV